jgi:hypothetical protein
VVAANLCPSAGVTTQVVLSLTTSKPSTPHLLATISSQTFTLSNLLSPERGAAIAGEQL